MNAIGIKLENGSTRYIMVSDLKMIEVLANRLSVVHKNDEVLTYYIKEDNEGWLENELINVLLLGCSMPKLIEERSMD